MWLAAAGTKERCPGCGRFRPVESFSETPGGRLRCQKCVDRTGQPATGVRRVRRPPLPKAHAVWNPKHASLAELDELRQQNRQLPLVARPLVRGDCQDGPRPCPFVGCRMHLGSNVSRRGTLQLMDLDEAGETCALDVADRGEHSFKEIGALMHLTKQRVAQILETALARAYAARRIFSDR
jgi:hypothetical protein